MDNGDRTVTEEARNKNDDVQNKDDCDLNGSMWDNNKLHQLQIKGNSNTIKDSEPKQDVSKGKFISSSKLHNHKTENSVKTIHNTTKSQRKTLYFLPNVPDNSTKDQTIEQQESVLSQSVPISSSACIKNIITPHKLHINQNNVTSYKNMLVTTPNKQVYMLRNHVDISNNRIKNQNSMWDNNQLHQLQIKGNSNTIKESEPKRDVSKGKFISSSKLHNNKNENSVKTIHNTTKSQRKTPYVLPNVHDNSIENQIIEKQESILSQSVPISSSDYIKNIITPHNLHEKEIINYHTVTDHTKQSNFEPINGLDTLSDATKDLNGVRIIYKGKQLDKSKRSNDSWKK